MSEEAQRQSTFARRPAAGRAKRGLRQPASPIRRRRTPTSVLSIPAAILVAIVLGANSHAGTLRAEAEAASQRNFAEYLDLLRLPNVAAVPADLARNADFLTDAFERRGFAVERVENAAGRPALVASLPAAAAGAPTVMFYVHYDGQPVIPGEWSQADPFEPVVRRSNDAGGWTDVGAGALLERPLDPELRVFARSAADDKAPIMMLLTAIDMLAASDRMPAFNVKVLLDGEEEVSSPNLRDLIGRAPNAFSADALVVLDGPVHASGQPTIVFGNRGIARVTLTVFGPRNPLHSGHYGNFAPNPAMRIASLLASMKDGDGRVVVDGFYDGVDLGEADRRALAAVDDDEQALLATLGIARPEQVGSNLQEALQYPSLNVRGLAAAGVGAAAANVIPSEAVAEIDIRTTPQTDGTRLYELLRRHIAAQGYRLVDAAPTDEERARHDRLARLAFVSNQPAARTPMDAPIGQWATSALRAPVAPTPGTDPVRIRMMGGTVPTDVLVDALGIPFVLVPTVNGDNNQHARDENLRIGNFVSGVETILSLLTTPFPH